MPTVEADVPLRDGRLHRRHSAASHLPWSMSSSERASRRRSDSRCSCRRPVRRVPRCPFSCPLNGSFLFIVASLSRVLVVWSRIGSVVVHARSGALRHCAVGGHGRRVAGDRDGVRWAVGIRATQPIGVSLHRADRCCVRTLHGAFHSRRHAIEDPAGGRGRGRGRR